MSKRKPGRTALRAALLAGAAVAALGLGAVSPGAASAKCLGVNTKMSGSTLQRVAQKEIWIPAWEKKCEGGPVVTYNGIGSGAGLNEWSANTAKGTINTETGIVITDDAPSKTQIGHISEAANGAEVLTIPVAQTAIAIIANPPTGCSISHISNSNLERAFAGKKPTWESIGATGSCTGAITRVVRADGSGTTYQFKHYLDLIESGTLQCAKSANWETLQTESPNTRWPQQADCGALEEVTAIHAESGGGNVAKYVNENKGTIGYVALPDAFEKANLTLLEVENGAEGGIPSYGSPDSPAEASPIKNTKANCLLNNQIYNLPKNAAGEVLIEKEEGWEKAGAPDTDWSTVYGSDPNIRKTLKAKGVSEAEAETAYPLCTFTYALGLTSYSQAGFKTDVFDTAFELLSYEVSESLGQPLLEGAELGYGKLFNAPGPEEAAQIAANNLGA